jgi:3-oxoacyl-[acyl-carrier protein] reductase
LEYLMTMQQNTRVAAQGQAPRDVDVDDDTLSAPSRSLVWRHILVLGGAGEVGEGIVRRLLVYGARVIALSRRDDHLAQLAARIEATYPPEAPRDWRDRLRPQAGDIAHAEGGPRLRDALAGTPLHGVVASLGGWRQGRRVVDTPPAVWDEALAPSLGAHVHAARLLLPLVERVADGSYTLINGGAATHPVPGAGAMCVSAVGQLMLKDVLAAEHAREPVRVNALLLATPVLTRSRPTGERGSISADDVGEWAAYLASPDAPHRGETFILDAPTPAPWGLPMHVASAV